MPVKSWTRATSKGTNPPKRRVNPTRVPIEAKGSIRWREDMRQATALLGDPARLVHLGDRENDIHEFFVSVRRGFQLPTTRRGPRERGTERDVGEAGEAAPDHDRSRRRISGPCQIAAEPRDLGQVGGERAAWR
jgi:hypothetical protein